MKPRPTETLADGSWLAELRLSGNAGRKATPLTIRVIDYRIDNGRHNDEPYRLFTTILDPDDVSAPDLAAAYTEHWEIESAFDELKTHRRGPRTVLRSKSPDLALQVSISIHSRCRRMHSQWRQPLHRRLNWRKIPS